MTSHLDYEINKELGECYLHMGDLEKAEEYYKKAAGSNGVHPDPYLGLATIAVQRGDLDGAHTLYGKAADIQATDKSLAGMALVEMELGRMDEAFANFGRALECNPENMIAIFGIIQTGYTLNRLDTVVPRLKSCLAQDPLKHDIRFSLAGCLMSMGDHDEAQKQLEQILAHEPGHEAAKELMSQARTQAA